MYHTSVTHSKSEYRNSKSARRPAGGREPYAPGSWAGGDDQRKTTTRLKAKWGFSATEDTEVTEKER